MDVKLDSLQNVLTSDPLPDRRLATSASGQGTRVPTEAELIVEALSTRDSLFYFKKVFFM